MSQRHDLVVLGAGSGGYATALRAAQLGLDVAMVEADKLGGTCLHRGCIPTKAWLHAAEVADQARSGPALGVHTSVDHVDAAAIVAWSRGIVERLHKGLTGLVGAASITRVSGHGTVVNDTGGLSVQVGDTVVRGERLVIATGAAPRTLGLPIDGERIITSDHALGLTTLPRTALVVGGGVIGVEIASAWASLGVEVTIVEALDRLLPGEEPETSRQLARALKKRGIGQRFGVRVTEAVAHTDVARLTLDDGSELTADVVLVAVGRDPRTRDLGLAEAGIVLEPSGHIRVDDHLATSVPGAHAVGDVVAGPQLAHRGFAHGLFVAEQIAHDLGRLDQAPTPPRDQDLPRVTYCSPEVASVGLTTEAAQAFGEVESATYPLGANGRSLMRGTGGFVTVLRVKGGPIVGVHMLGDGVSELIGEAQLITGWEALPEDVAPLLHGHPTQTEALGEACLALAGRALHLHA